MTDPAPLPLRRRSARSAADLAEAGVVAPERAAAVAEAGRSFPALVTPTLLDLMTGDSEDPLARQFVPSPEELAAHPDDLPDPIGDDALSPVKGVVHRYPDRVLLKPLLSCPVHCRFCFRREHVGAEEALSEAELTAALHYVRARPDIWEVILTGGDPLMLPPARLSRIVRDLDAIPHVGVIRLHTRIPVVDPARVTAALAAALAADKAVYVVLHANHPRELTAEAKAACRRLTDAGIPLLAQTVLLKGVNDDAKVLEELMRLLVGSRIKPYYLHHCDLAPGTGHFRLSIPEGLELARALRGRVSGLCQPTYVLDIPGGYGKVPLGPNYLDEAAGEVEDWRGNRHRYPPR
jgi:lysine 2,3-aminomutase